MASVDDRAGHRRRLRQRFQADPLSLSEEEICELLLTYAIPRRDVAASAHQLIERFGKLDRVLAASYDELARIPGIGENAATLITLVGRLVGARRTQTVASAEAGRQPQLFHVEPRLGPLFDAKPDESETEPEMHTFANDEIDNAIAFVPQALKFGTFGDFKAFLVERLPYNSASTRVKRANHILHRYFPNDHLDVPLIYYAAHCRTPGDFKPALFYETLKAEPLAARVAEDFIWPALPVGRIGREGLRKFIGQVMPEISAASQAKVLRAVFNTYDRLSVGRREGDALTFQVHTDSLDAFLYVLTAEFPRPGMYSFEALDQGPPRRWLLWDREWMRRQLYNLRDLGIVSKVSEIDALRQFTLQFDQSTALRRYFEKPKQNDLALRERTSS
jgi:DNA repair protein RadC